MSKPTAPPLTAPPPLTEPPATPAPVIPFLDRMLDPAAAAEWLGISVDTLMERYRKKKVPGIAIGHRTVRFHPRSITEHFARERTIP